jgi:hypothetical protein
VSARFAGWEERTFALALDEVTVGLEREERVELHSRVRTRDLEELELAIAELHVAALGELESPPAELMRRISDDAHAWLDASKSQPPAVPLRRARAPFWAAAGWLAAALVLAMLVLERVRSRPLDPAERREQLLAHASDLVRAPWKPSGDPLAGGVTGEVVWSRSRQEGYMTLRSLPPNDPARNQYQLWIFDRTRPDWEAKPIDGGVFDVGASDEVIVPIDAKLEVRQAALFAVTLEPPGGVVVSAREHLLATATP